MIQIRSTFTTKRIDFLKHSPDTGACPNTCLVAAIYVLWSRVGFHVVWGYPLTTMPRPKAAHTRYYKAKGKAGYRMYHGRKYLGYSISKPDAISKPKPLAERMRESKKTLALKVYKHVITRQTKKGPRYHGHIWVQKNCLLYTSPSPRDATLSRMPSSA